MRQKRSTKGQMRVIETILASFIVVFALSFVSTFAAVPASTTYEVTDLEKMGYSVLQDLDQNGLLARFVYSEDWEPIKAALRVTLPLDVYFNMTVYDLNHMKLDDGTIFYRTSGTFATSKNIASITYALAGYPERDGVTGNYQAALNPRIIILQLARG